MKQSATLFFAFMVLTGTFGTGKAQVVHPSIGETFVSKDSSVIIRLENKKQSFTSADSTYDSDINSPKSVNVHPDGKRFYVNSLEGATTVCYSLESNEKLSAVQHRFDGKRDSTLWSKPSGFFNWNHYFKDQGTFFGKPVESTFSHGGRYLWIPYYRRSFDINAQDPSAVAIIDTRTDSIIRLMETGPLPKMIATSNDGTLIVISHWGDNTVGLIDISSERPDNWKYTDMFVVDYQLKLDYPLDHSVDRDNNSGYALRGTVFTPDNKYLLVGCMGGGGGIAVIDIPAKKYLGRLMGMMSNVRHLVISSGYLYLSINGAGYIQRAKLSDVISAIGRFSDKVSNLTSWENVKVGKGARTICITPDGNYVFAACNNESSLYVVDTRSMSVIGSIQSDSYPVGLDMSQDGSCLILTSQGRSGNGGNCVDIFSVTYKLDVSKQRCPSCGGNFDARGRCSACGFLLVHNEPSQPVEQLPVDTISNAADPVGKTDTASFPLIPLFLSIGSICIGFVIWRLIYKTRK